jgi:hypothetical protein
MPPTTHSRNPCRACNDSPVSIGGVPRRPGRGRRDNGLIAAEYAVAGDVDPRVGEHLLDVLGAGGIAAYLQPAADLHPVTRTTTMPSRPTDRLYVDREHLATARDYLAQLAEPGSTPAGSGRSPAEPAIAPAPDTGPREPGAAPEAAAEVDAAWAQIVAEYDADPPAEQTPWPDSENVDAGRAAEGPAPRPATAPPLRRLDHPSLLDALDTFGADLPDEDEGSYTPPPPPPLPRPSATTVVAVLAIAVGFLLFMRPTLMPLDQDLARVLGFAGVLAGVVALIWRLRPGDEEDGEQDPEDGAVV